MFEGEVPMVSQAQAGTQKSAAPQSTAPQKIVVRIPMTGVLRRHPEIGKFVGQKVQLFPDTLEKTKVGHRIDFLNPKNNEQGSIIVKLLNLDNEVLQQLGLPLLPTMN